MKEFIGSRIKEERNKQKMDQQKLAEKTGLGWQRQTIGEIESGNREVKVWELAKVAEALHKDLTFFLPNQAKPNAEPFVLWRYKPEENSNLEAEFIKKCREYRLLEQLLDKNTDSFSEIRNREISVREFDFTNATQLAEEIRNEMNLGDYPASSLVKILEDKYGYKFFFQDLEGKGSAASCVDDFGKCILVSAKEAPWRQHFSIAHELFHIITWNRNLWAEVCADPALWKKNEQLAEAFAGALLLPTEVLARELQKVSHENKVGKAALVAVARQFEVSVDALCWRMRAIRLISQATAESLIADPEIKKLNKNRIETDQSPNYAMSSRFIRLAYVAHEVGKISKARLAKMFSVNIADLPKFLEKLGLGELSNNEISLSNP